MADKKSAYRNHGLKPFSLHNSGRITVTTSLNTHYSDDSSGDESCHSNHTINSIGTWASEKENDGNSYDLFDMDAKKYMKDIMNASSSSTSVSTSLMNSSSSHTLYIKDNSTNHNNNNCHPLQHHHEFSLESDQSSDNCSFLSEDSASTPSILSIGSYHDKYYPHTKTSNSNNNNTNKIINSSNNNTILPLTPPHTPTHQNQHSKAGSSLQQKYSKIRTPPILSYFPSEILIHIAMSTDFDTLLNLRLTCRFFHAVLDIPGNWADYWKYTSDRVECLNSLVTSVYQSDEYIFGEVLEPINDKYIIFDRRKDYHLGYPSSPHDPIPNFIYRRPSQGHDSNHDLEKLVEIPIERILFIDSFSTRFGFSYLGGLRIYVPYEYGNVIVHFYDRPAAELPCSLEHYHEYECSQLGHHLTPFEGVDTPHSVQNCPQCIRYFQKNSIDYTVTCSGRPVSHISAIWKYHVTSKYTFSFDIINSRSENGYGYRTQDAFIHTNYSFLVNGRELPPGKAALFRKFVLKSE